MEIAIGMQIQQIFIIFLPHTPCRVLCALPFSPTTTTQSREILFCIFSSLSHSRSLWEWEISMICMQIRLVTRIIKCFTHISTQSIYGYDCVILGLSEHLNLNNGSFVCKLPTRCFACVEIEDFNEIHVNCRLNNSPKRPFDLNWNGNHDLWFSQSFFL